ncbi:hypothetical protein [Halioxenophilus sp. WMMB6]|uniref:hypothetical protein n=1 Tax=Halioxenophilus sp. WMMB6 TaxID=3073815 RepID=UPI00295F52EA|nr:hypothetical protein [Halioxenophilus sp. WMMB6]
MKNLLLSSVIVVTGLFASYALAGDATNANLVIFRTIDVAQTRGIHYRLLVDGEEMGKLKPDTVISLQLAPGEHVITASDKKQSQMVVTVSAGETAFVTGSVDRKRVMNFSEAEPTEAVLATLADREAVVMAE